MELLKNRNIPKVALVVLLFNGMKWIDSCFKSLFETDYPNFQVIVVDNNSSDDSVSMIRKNFKNVTIIENARNLGTAVGNNIGIQHALSIGADYIVLFNQDIKVPPSWLTKLMEVAIVDEKIGILSPIQYNYEETDIDPGFLLILNKTDYFKDKTNGDFSNYYSAKTVIGASILIKKELFLNVGLFDPIYFMYHEDTDLCQRARHHGYKVVIVTGSKVFHYHAAKTHKNLSDKISFRIKRNELILKLKDPEHSFFYNLKNVFLWTNWNRLFEGVESKDWKIFTTFVFLVFHMPLIYIRRYKECRFSSI